MRLGNGSHRRTPVWIWFVLLVCSSLVLPGAALVFGQAQDSRVKEKQPAVSQPLVELHQSDNRGPATQSKLQKSKSVPGTPQRWSQIEGVKLPSVNLNYQQKDWTTQRRDISRLLEKLKKEDIDVSPEHYLMRTLSQGLSVASQTELGSNDPPPFQFQTDNGSFVLQGKNGAVAIQNEDLVVHTAAKHHEMISKWVDDMEKFGFKEVVIETRFIGVTHDLMKKLNVDWSISNSSLGTEVSDDPNEPSPKFDFDFENLDNVSTTAIVQQNQIAFYSTVDSKKLKTILRQTNADPKSNILLAPTVTMFNGQKATIKDSVRRPFVVSLKPLNSQPNDSSDTRLVDLKPANVQPIIRLVEDGLSLQVNPILDESTNMIQLNCGVTISKIRDVQTYELPIKRKDGSTLNIQIPEVATTRILSSIKLEPGKTLLLSTQRENEDGKKEPFVAALTCTVVSPQKGSTVEAALSEFDRKTSENLPLPRTATNQTTSRDQILRNKYSSEVFRTRAKAERLLSDDGPAALKMMQDLRKKTETVGLEPKLKEPLLKIIDTDIKELKTFLKMSALPTEATYTIHVSQTQSTKNENEKVFELFGVRFLVNGDIHYQMNNAGAKLQGKDLTIKMTQPDGTCDAKLTCSAGTVEVIGDKQIKFICSDGVQMEAWDMSLSADQIDFASDESDFDLQLKGEAKGNCDLFQFSSDSMHYDSSKQIVILKGNVSFNHQVKGNEQPIRLRCEQLRWNPQNNQIEIEDGEK